MPTTVFTVQRVDSTPTVKPGVTLHLVSGSTGSGLPFQVRTVNDFAASICQMAQRQEQPVSVIWKDGRYGMEIVQVNILRECDGESVWT